MRKEYSLKLLSKVLTVAVIVGTVSPLLAQMDRPEVTENEVTAEMAEGFPHPFFNHMGIPDMPGMVSIRVSGYRQGKRAEASKEDFGIHIEAGLYNRVGLHIRNSEIKESPRTDVMLMYSVIQDRGGKSGVSVFGGALVPSGTIPEKEEGVIGAFGVSGRYFLEKRAVFDGNIHYMPQMKMYEMGFSGIFKTGYRLFLLPHQLNNSSFERTRRGEMCVKKSEGLPVGNSKIFSCADCLVSFSPKGEALSPILGVRFS